MSNNRKTYFAILLLLLAFSLALTSCNCLVFGEGFVFDAQTQQPLDSVKVDSYINGKDSKYSMTTYSDPDGFFYGSTGNTKGCKALEIRLSKPGYESTRIMNPDSARIYLKKI